MSVIKIDRDLSLAEIQGVEKEEPLENNFISNDLRVLSIENRRASKSVEAPIEYDSSIPRNISFLRGEETETSRQENFIYNIPNEDRAISIEKTDLKKVQDIQGNKYGVKKDVTWKSSNKLKGATFNDFLVLDGGFF